jgi:hypothetical protein
LFAPDAYISDNGREFRGTEAVRGWVETEIVAAKVTMDVREAIDHHGDVILRAAYDGEFDRTGLPPEVVLTGYYAVRDGKIVSLVISFDGSAAAAAWTGGRIAGGFSHERPQSRRSRGRGQGAGGAVSRAGVWLRRTGAAAAATDGPQSFADRCGPSSVRSAGESRSRAVAAWCQ